MLSVEAQYWKRSSVPGYHEFFCDRNPNMGKAMNLILGPVKEETISTENRREDVRQFKQSIQQQVKWLFNLVSIRFVNLPFHQA